MVSVSRIPGQYTERLAQGSFGKNTSPKSRAAYREKLTPEQLQAQLTRWRESIGSRHVAQKEGSK